MILGDLGLCRMRLAWTKSSRVRSLLIEAPIALQMLRTPLSFGLEGVLNDQSLLE